jgi:OOP family OmpA-OmpF porin
MEVVAVKMSAAILYSVLLSFLFVKSVVAGDGYWYVGGSIGPGWDSGQEDLNQEDVANAVAITGLPAGITPSIVGTSTGSDAWEEFDDVGWKLYGGYQFNDYLGIEALYAELGSFERSAQLSGAVGLFAPAYLEEEAEVDGFGLALVASVPLGSSFSAFGKAGVFSWETDTSGRLGIQTGTICAIFICGPIADRQSYSVDDSGSDPMFGLGMEFAGGGWGLRLEWERFTGLAHGFDAEADMDLFTLGIQYQFGIASD